ncbi:hypothetical protein [Scopulibacillus cellulosilyticus]|uniref:Peptidyl-prolyl cis-trans isomerase n=1 Tax=Scopulibacillus cellulosilyticus TaxID=2665665 RepID=A0ABW2PYV2_9BACL
MQTMLNITGRVKFTITMDPTSLLFDDRKIKWEDFLNMIDHHIDFLNEEDETDTPPFKKKRRKYKREDMLTESFVIPVKPFIENAEPLEDATIVVFERQDGDHYELSLTEAKQGVFAFSYKGRALTEDGPLHFYYGNGSNKDHPVRGIQKIVIK